MLEEAGLTRHGEPVEVIRLGPTALPERPTRAPRFWETIAWGALAKKLLRGLRALLWAALKSPWRAIRWYRALTYPTLTYVRYTAFVLTMLLVALYLLVARPVWLVETLARVEAARHPTATQVPVAEAPQPEPICAVVRVTANGVRLRAAAGQQSAILRRLQQDERLSALDCVGVAPDEHTWWRVVDASGREGWVAIDWLEVVEVQP